MEPDQLDLISKLRKLKYRIVFTNGCYDVIHAGHVLFFNYLYKKYTEEIIIGINSDESIKRLKGDNRPINTLIDRLIILKALRSIQAIFPFYEDTPIELIKAIKPDVLAKGGDYKDKLIVGEEFVRSYGGIIDKDFYYEGHSSTKIINHA
jgi:D-beta-D-heptose 7-phosphate kinase/D-beta-D-heptose 1-phosphate adenosyltransferase